MPFVARLPASVLAYMLILALTVWGMAPAAQAGAWPRKQGTGFASLSVRLGWPQGIDTWISTDPTEDYTTLYAEYGLTDKLTVGLDVGLSKIGSGKRIVFLQWPLRQSDKGANISAQLGLGTIGEQRILRPGLSLGWGATKGWLTFDAMAESYTATGQHDLKMDMTWGRNLAKDRKLILQLQTGAPDGQDPYARFAPSLVAPLLGPIKMESGVSWGLTGDSSMGLKFGLWTDF